MKACLRQAFEHMFTRRLCSKLPGESQAMEERREMRNYGPLAFGVLVSAHLGIDSGKHCMR
jgi:hypothetical protein